MHTQIGGRIISWHNLIFGPKYARLGIYFVRKQQEGFAFSK